MGSPLGEPLYYLHSTRILVRTGLYFDINLHTYPEPVKVLMSFPRRIFVLILTTKHLDVTLDRFFFFLIFIQSTQVLVTWSLLLLCVVSERLICVHAKTRSR